MLICGGFVADSPTTPLGPITFDRRDVGIADVVIDMASLAARAGKST